mgnify:FL=1
MIKVIRYDSSNKVIWNEFVKNAKNGMFLFNRGFMDYHSDRFNDHSLMMYRDDKLLAILPANEKENLLYSHQGLTYGGLILCRDSRAINTVEVLKAIIDYCTQIGMSKLIYKAVPHIFHQFPSEEDLYAIYVLGGDLISRASSVVLSPKDKLKTSKGRKTMIGRAKKEGVKVNKTDDLSAFYEMMVSLLDGKYDSKPTHTLDELKSLTEQFPNSIKLFTSNLNDELLAGVVIFETEKVAHFQYISTTPVGRDFGGLDIIVDELISTVYKDKDYIDFGTSIDDGKFLINENLIKNKESFGARSVMQDVYEISI